MMMMMMKSMVMMIPVSAICNMITILTYCTVLPYLLTSLPSILECIPGVCKPYPVYKYGRWTEYEEGGEEVSPAMASSIPQQ